MLGEGCENPFAAGIAARQHAENSNQDCQRVQKCWANSREAKSVLSAIRIANFRDTLKVDKIIIRLSYSMHLERFTRRGRQKAGQRLQVWCSLLGYPGMSACGLLHLWHGRLCDGRKTSSPRPEFDYDRPILAEDQHHQIRPRCECSPCQRACREIASSFAHRQPQSNQIIPFEP